MSRRPRDSQQAIPSLRNSTSTIPPPPSLTTIGNTRIPPPPPSLYSSSTSIAPTVPSSANTSIARSHLQQQPHTLLLKLQAFATDNSNNNSNSSNNASFQNFDLASLDENELCDFLSQAIELIDSPFFHPSQPTHSRFITALIRCINTMPWGRIYSVVTTPANLPVESSKHQKHKNKIAAPGTPLFKIPASNRARAYPTNMHDLHAFAKTTKRKLSALYALLAIKLGNFSPSHIPDILSSTLQYFTHVPPVAQVSSELWNALPALLSTSDHQQQQHPNSNNNAAISTSTAASPNHPAQTNSNNNNSSSSSPATISLSCRAYASALTTWLDNEIDTPLFRIVASLLARYEEYQTQGSVARNHQLASALKRHNNASNNNNSNIITTAGGPSSVCMSVLERSVPKKHWPVFAHHLSWFSVMGKFFQFREVEAMSKALGELEAAQNSRYSVSVVSLFNPPNSSGTNPNNSSSSQPTSSTQAANASNSNNNNNNASSPGSSSSLVMRLSTQSTNFSLSQNSSSNAGAGNPTFSSLGPPTAIQQRAESFLISESVSAKIVKLMLNGLLNLETLAKQSRENAAGARRCAAIFVDSMVAVAYSKTVQKEKTTAGGGEQKQKLSSPSHQPASNNQKKQNKSSQQQQQQQQQIAMIGSELDVEEDIFPVILRHYLENVIVFSGQSTSCSHAVPVAVAIGLDFVCLGSNDDDENDDGHNNNKKEKDASSSNNSCVRTLVFACINRLGKAFSVCSHLNLFNVVEGSKNDNNNNANSRRKKLMRDEENNQNNKSSRNNNSGTGNQKVPHHHTSTSSASTTTDIHSELLAFSHLVSILKSFVNLAQRSPQFLYAELLMKHSFNNNNDANSNSGLASSLQEIITLLKKKIDTTMSRTTEDAADENESTSRSSAVANWLLKDVIEPFCEKFGFDHLLLVEDDEDNNDDDDDDDKFQRQLSRKMKGSLQPEITKKIWTSYRAFMQELLPIVI